MAPKSYRTTITIPQSLKERMDAVGDSVNWSALAARAFEAKLLEIELRSKRTMSKEDVLKRLRAAKAEDDEEEVADGKQAGREWAEQDARPKELRRLEGLYSRCTGREWEDFFDAPGSTAYSTAERLLFTLHPENDGDRQEAGSFWEGALGDDKARAEEDAFLQGFAEGALEVWNEVKDSLDRPVKDSLDRPSLKEIEETILRVLDKATPRQPKEIKRLAGWPDEVRIQTALDNLKERNRIKGSGKEGGYLLS
jgi:hypothetical protein